MQPLILSRRGLIALAALTPALAVLAPSLAGCSRGSDRRGTSGAGRTASSTAPSAAALLAQARATLDATDTIRFTLSSEGVPAGVSALLGGEGSAARPDAFAGDLDVSVSGNRAKISVVSLHGTVYAKLPFAATYAVTDPAAFSIPDPGRFLSPTAGLTQLLTAATGAALGGTSRDGSAVLQEVTADLPGSVVGTILRTADPATPVRATFGIDPATHRLRTARLAGPFFAQGVTSTYTLGLSRYGETVDIRVPAH